MAANQSVEEIFAGLDESRIQENRASQQLLRVKGDGSPAIIVCSYGNRDYEDMLVELKDLLTANGFRNRVCRRIHCPTLRIQKCRIRTSRYGRQPYSRMFRLQVMAASIGHYGYECEYRI